MIKKNFGGRGCSKSNMAVEAFKDERANSLLKAEEGLKFNKVSDWTDSIPKGDKPKSPDIQADSSDGRGDA